MPKTIHVNDTPLQLGTARSKETGELILFLRVGAEVKVLPRAEALDLFQRLGWGLAEMAEDQKARQMIAREWEG